MTILSYLGAGAMMYIGYKVMTSNPDLSSKNHNMVVLGFWGGATMQLINGKTWALAIMASSTYVSPSLPLETQAFTLWLAFISTNFLFGLPWIFGALWFKKWLSTPDNLRIVNIILGTGMMISIIMSLS